MNRRGTGIKSKSGKPNLLLLVVLVISIFLLLICWNNDSSSSTDSSSSLKQQLQREESFTQGGGDIHRGDVGSGATEEWMPEGADGRFTARGITTDRHDNVYIAGGPNGLGTDRPDMWVYSAGGDLLAALKVDAPNAFINDVTIGPDGAAYFTNSNAPQIFRVSNDGDLWQVETWLDATGTITQEPGFNLGGIVVSPDRQALVVAQGNVGALWNVDLTTKAAVQIDTGSTDLVNADGLVLRGHRLTVIRNFSRMLTTLKLDGHANSATLVTEYATSADRVFTTGKIARGRLLLIDSKFDEPVAEPPYEVVSLRLADGPA